MAFVVLADRHGDTGGLLLSGEGIAIPELVASIPGVAWLGLLGMRLAKTAAP